MNRLETHEEYSNAINDLNSLQSNTQVLALAKYKHPESILPLFQKQLSLVGIQPQNLNKLNAIHVSGTKGKGSTCALLESILRAQQGRPKVGSYNSPHLVHVTERIRLNGRPIERALFTKYFRHVYDKLKLETRRQGLAMPSYFAFLTILAFHIFLEERVDWTVVEVGIGGEFDPTNVISEPVACAITTLDLDHTNILGNTIRSIAHTKAGIIKPRVPMFTVEHEQREALDSILARARERDSRVFVCKRLNASQLDNLSRGQLGISGPAQATNAALACQLAKYCLDPTRAERVPPPDEDFVALETNLAELPESFRLGLRDCRLAGRCQVIECPSATFFLDGAHTRKSMENCIKWFRQTSRSINGEARRFLIVNVIGERDKKQVLLPLVEYRLLFDKIIFTTNSVHPAAGASEISNSDPEMFVRLQDVNHERGQVNVENNARAWAELTNESNWLRAGDAQILLKSSITQSIAEIMVDGLKSKPHILATGSLHFVGAVIRAIMSSHPNRADLH